MRSLIEFVIMLAVSFVLSYFAAPFMGVILAVVLGLLAYAENGKLSLAQKELLTALVLGGLLGGLLHFNPLSF